MAYTKNTWQTGDIVTSAKLNNMEEGIANAYPLYVDATFVTGEYDMTGTLNKTWQEIYDAYSAGRLIIVNEHGENMSTKVEMATAAHVEVGDEPYHVYTSEYTYSSATASGYPQYYEDWQ